MRTTLGLASAAVLAVATLATTGATAAPAPVTAPAALAAPTGVTAVGEQLDVAVAESAVAALLARPAAARVEQEGVEQESVEQESVEQKSVEQESVEQELVPTSTLRDADGSTHVRMRRTYGGLPVLGGDLVVHQGPGGAWEGVSQTLRRPLTLGVQPGIGRQQAVTRALAPAAATADLLNLRAAEAAPRLVVDTLAGPARLAFAVQTLGRQEDGTPSRLTSYVDARTGAVLRREEGIHTAEGEGESLYSGTVPLSVQQSSSTFTLTDVDHGNGRTTDMQNKQDNVLCQLLRSCGVGVAFTSPDNRFGNGSTSSRESAAVDAHFGAATTFDYFKDVHGRNGIFGDGRGVPSRVHYGNGYVNAFWDGTKMTYGDGDGSSFGPLVSLDVAGHEMSHGITENTANLTYSGESGGLNEATSDIFGTMVEFYAATDADPGDYYIGEEFDLASGEGFRRMDDPQLDGSSFSCYEAGLGEQDVHYTSGVANHFFYLLAEGSGTKTIGGKVHTSPTCDGSTVAGIGRDDAAAIWWRALDVYMTSGTTYAQARTATVQAATDLFGAGSTQATTVAAAWSAVAVG
ncbi:M4 family metallopeptidase [Nocardioides nanhaiensis]|uniref:Neutral metalloproteinase n=1 Tax=Nocardioides nanhaiensis TaxID=1476871 RepID=A0ABP8WWY8_9ACTN